MPRVKIKVRRPIRLFKRPEFYFSILLLGLVSGFLWFTYGPSTYQSSDNIVDLQVEASPVLFPQDDGPHETMTEWWYYNGHLVTKEGERFSYHYTLFAHKTLSTHSIIHATLLDHQTMKTYRFQQRIPGFQTNQHPNGRFVLGAPPWQVSLLQGQDIIQGEAPEFKFGLKLASNELVLQEADAILDFKDAGESYYYSRPRMKTKGNLEIEGKEYNVEGQSWFDHQWGEFRATVLSWDWFALQLDSGYDIMLFDLSDFNDNEVHLAGTVFFQGTTHYLTKEDFKITPGEVWKSEVSGYEYPVEWTIVIPRFNLDLKLQAVKKSSEFDAVNTTYSFYWEGPVVIIDNRGRAEAQAGLGFIEISKANAQHAQ